MNAASGRKAAYIIGIMGLALLGGCDGPIGLDGRAQVDTTLGGGGSEEVAGSTSNGTTPAPATSSSSSTSSGSSATGSVDVRARVLVQSEGGVWREATNGFVDQRVSIDGSDGLKLLSQTRLEADEYVRVRVEFERVDATVTGGLTIGLSNLTGQIAVSSGLDGRIVIEREVRFTAASRTRTRINVALNAREWLATASTTTRIVAESDFQSAVVVDAR